MQTGSTANFAICSIRNNARKHAMKILITGGKGMLGRTLQRHFKDDELFIADLPDVDILNYEQLAGSFESFKPDVVIHTAAMTKVDACEDQIEFTFKLNAIGSRNVARASSQYNSRLIAISTDYVFSGKGTATPFREDSLTAPATVYGITKLAGEHFTFAEAPDAVILRTAWLYGAGGPSFIHTMAKLGAQSGAPLKVVNDQFGNPTSTDAVADAIKFIIAHPDMKGIVHGTCEGICSWYDLTVKLFSLLNLKREVIACKSSEYPCKTPRPAFSALEKSVFKKFAYRMPDWERTVEQFVRTEFQGEA